MKALVLNCTLKKSPAPSNTQMLAGEVISALEERGVECETVRLVDLNIAPGVSSDEGNGDQWPRVREKILASDILLFAPPPGSATPPASRRGLSNAWTRCSPNRTRRGR